MTLADLFMWTVVVIFAVCGVVITWLFYDFERAVDEKLQATRRLINADRAGDSE